MLARVGVMKELAHVELVSLRMRGMSDFKGYWKGRKL
jgi:hypothetical protein